MKDRENGRRTFVQDLKMTQGILNIVAEIANSSVTTYKEREDASLKYYKMLEKASERKILVLKEDAK